jgi:hypothetical protein
MSGGWAFRTLPDAGRDDAEGSVEVTTGSTTVPTNWWTCHVIPDRNNLDGAVHCSQTDTVSFLLARGSSRITSPP